MSVGFWLCTGFRYSPPMLHTGLGLPHEPVTWKDDHGEFLRQVLGVELQAVCHLHGRWNRTHSVIFGRGDYESIVRDRRVQFLQKAAPTFRSLVFVGFGQGGEAPNFSRLLEWIISDLGDTLHQHFCLICRGDAPVIKVFVPVSYGDDHGDLAAFLRQLAVGRQTSGRRSNNVRGPTRRVPAMAPLPPADFVPRPELIRCSG